MESTITSKLATNSSKVFEVYPFLTLNYWFSTPNELSLDKMVPLEMVVILVFIFPLGLLAYKLQKSGLTPPEHKFLTKAFWLTIFFGPVGFLLILFRNLGIVLLSARFFWIVWFGLLFWALFYLYRFHRKSLVEQKQTYAAYSLKKRYFPKKKKR